MWSLQGVSDAQQELDEAEEKKRDAELDIILTLRAMPGAGSGMSAALDQHARGGKIVTVSQKRFVSTALHAQHGDCNTATATSDLEPEPEPEAELKPETRTFASVTAEDQAEAARCDRLAGFGCSLDGLQDNQSRIRRDVRWSAVEGLKAAPFVVLDHFVGSDLCTAVRAEVQRLDEQGHLTEGELGGGRTGANLTYNNSKVSNLFRVQRR